MLLPTPTSASALAATSISTLQDSQKSGSDSKTTGNMETSTTWDQNKANKNQRSTENPENKTSQPDDGDSKTPGESEFDYHALSQEVPASTEDCTGQNGQTGATFIGGQFFPLPSPHGWKLALKLTKQLRPLSDYLMMGQRIHLA
jgi:hypothetical protein